MNRWYSIRTPALWRIILSFQGERESNEFLLACFTQEYASMCRAIDGIEKRLFWVGRSKACCSIHIITLAFDLIVKPAFDCNHNSLLSYTMFK